MLEKRNIADKAEQTGVTLPDMGRTFRLYYRPLCLFALRYIPDTELSEDIVMESMESFWLKVSTPGAVSFRIMENLKSYLFVSVRNRCISELRKRRQVLVMGKRDGLSYEEISEKLGISVNTVRNHMSRALAALKHEYRDVNFVPGEIQAESADLDSPADTLSAMDAVRKNFGALYGIQDR